MTNVEQRAAQWVCGAIQYASLGDRGVGSAVGGEETDEELRAAVIEIYNALASGRFHMKGKDDA